MNDLHQRARQLQRVIKLMRLVTLRPGASLDYYAGILRVCPRTIRRDLDAIEDLPVRDLPGTWRRALEAHREARAWKRVGWVA